MPEGSLWRSAPRDAVALLEAVEVDRGVGERLDDGIPEEPAPMRQARLCSTVTAAGYRKSAAVGSSAAHRRAALASRLVSVAATLAHDERGLHPPAGELDRPALSLTPPWKRVLGTAVGAVDRAFVVAMQMRGSRDRSRTHLLGRDDRIAVLNAIHRAYDVDPARFFAPPAAIDPMLRLVRTGSPPRTETWDAHWRSTFEPYLAEVSAAYLAHVENRTARARLFFGDLRAPRRPAVIALHGYMGGHWMLEEAQWPLAWLTKRGLDVALPLLPFHALRGGPRRGAPPFPSADPRLTNEGFRQAIADVSALARWLRERGAPQVGVMGMSLGGYTAALLATIAKDLDFVMPMIPLASLADFAREQGELGTGPEADAQHAALGRANRIVSPLLRPLAIASSRALVVAAEHDRITPRHHAEQLAAHFGCSLVTIPGGHLVQLGRAEAFRGLGALLEREGIIAPRPGRR